MLSLHLLGDPVLTRDGEALAGRATYRRRMAVLAILAVARGRPVGRERIIALLWPDSAMDAARHLLSESLSVFRKELGDEALVTTGDGVGLSPAAVASDVDAFEAAIAAGEWQAAVAAYGGPFLDGFFVEGAAAFEPWAQEQRDRLGRAYAGAVERLAEAAEAEGSALGAVDWWRRLAAHDPFSSRVAVRLAGALDAAGERASAVRALDAHTALMREELQMPPGAEVEQLALRLRTEAPPAPAEVRTPSPAAAPPLAAAPEHVPMRETAAATPIAQPSLSDGSEPAAASIAPPVTAAVASPGDALAPSPRGTRWGMRRMVAAAATGIAAGGVLAGLLASRQRTETPAAPSGNDPRRIAVLYFDDTSPGGGMRYLADGLTESLAEQLGQVPALQVASPGAARAYRDGRLPLDSLVARLGVGMLVEGSVQRAGDSVRVQVRLVDAATQMRLESRSVTRPVGALFALEDAVAGEVADFLRRRVGREVRLREAASAPAGEEARTLVLRAQEASARAHEAWSARDAVDRQAVDGLLWDADSLLSRAQAAEPRWARPLVLRGWVRLSMGTMGGHAEQVPQAAAFARQALEVDSADAGGFELRGRAAWESALRERDGARAAALLSGAERDLRRAADVDSSLASVWATLSQVLRVRGRYAEADAAARRALAQDAWLEDAGDILQRLYFSSLMTGDYAGARSLCARGHAQFPGEWAFVECRLTLLRADPAERPDPALARRLVAQLDSLDPPERARAAGRAYSPVYRRMAAAAVEARAGQADSARATVAWAQRQVAGDADQRLSLAFDEAGVRLLLGERAEARRLLDRYVAGRPAMRAFVERDPVLRALAR